MEEQLTQRRRYRTRTFSGFMTRCRTFLLVLVATLAACQSARVDIDELNAQYRDTAYLWTIERNREQHRQLQSALAQDSRAMLWHHNCSIGDARITAPIPTMQLSKEELARVKEILHRAEPCTSPVPTECRTGLIRALLIRQSGRSHSHRLFPRIRPHLQGATYLPAHLLQQG